jgi:hypothetical protein
VAELAAVKALAGRVTAAGGKPTADRLAAIMEKNARASKSGDDRTAQRMASMIDATRTGLASVTSAANATTAAVNKWSGFTIPAPVVNTTVTVTGFTVRTLNRKTTVNRSINPVDPRLHGSANPT